MVRKKASNSSGDSATEHQITLFAESQQIPDPFRKAVQVLHSVPATELGVVQRRLANAWLKHAIQQTPDGEGWWTLGIGELCQEINYTSRNRKPLKDAAKALMSVVYEYDVLSPGTDWKGSVFFPEIEFAGDRVRYQISRQIQEKVLNPAVFALIDMAVIRQLTRVASAGIFEHCIRYERIGRTPALPWQTLRDIALGRDRKGPSASNSEYKYFKNKHLVPAVAEINSVSKHVLELVEEKVGRSVSTIWFKVGTKEVPADAAGEQERVTLIEELRKLKMPKSEATKLVKANTPQAIRRALEYTTKRMHDVKLRPLESPASYFRQTLANGWADGGVESAAGVAPQASQAKKATAKDDLVSKFKAARLVEAQGYFNELEKDEQGELIERYNAQQDAPTLLIKGTRRSKAAQTAFLGWLASETWGEPSSEELLTFATQLLLNQGT